MSAGRRRRRRWWRVPALGAPGRCPWHVPPHGGGPPRGPSPAGLRQTAGSAPGREAGRPGPGLAYPFQGRPLWQAGRPGCRTRRPGRCRCRARRRRTRSLWDLDPAPGQQGAHGRAIGHGAHQAGIGPAEAPGAGPAVVGRGVRVVLVARAVAEDDHQRGEALGESGADQQGLDPLRLLLVRVAQAGAWGLAGGLSLRAVKAMRVSTSGSTAVRREWTSRAKRAGAASLPPGRAR